MAVNFLIPALMALGSGIANAFSDSSTVKGNNKKISQAQALLRDNLIDEQELADRLNENKVFYNNSIASLLNKTALTSRGFNNSGVIGAAVASPVLANMAQSANQIKMHRDENNRQVNSQIAQVGLGEQTADPVGSFFGGAIPGLTAGIEMAKYAGGPSSLKPVLDNVDPKSNVDPESSVNPMNNISRNIFNTRRSGIGMLGKVFNNKWFNLDANEYNTFSAAKYFRGF